MSSGELPERFPHLFREVIWPWGPTKARFMLLDKVPADGMIANVNMVPIFRDKWVMIRLRDGSWEIPGGKLKSGEAYLETISRELLEEVGAKLLSFHLFGAWHCISLAKKPYRAHLPFPEYYRLVGRGEIDIVERPGNPAGAEEVEAVERVSLETAVARFRSDGRHDLAEIYQLAAELKQ